MISKLEEKIISGNWCYTKFQTLLTDNQYKSASEFLGEMIQSNYHFWQGDEHKDGMTWTWSDENGKNVEHPHVKTFGFYDNNAIKPGDYKVIDHEIMENRLASFIKPETDGEGYANEIRSQVRLYKDQRLTVYQFLPDNLETSQFSVYSFFIAFVLVDKDLKKVIRIESGQD